MKWVPFNAQYPWKLSGANLYKDDEPTPTDPNIIEVTETRTYKRWGRQYTDDILWRRNDGWDSDLVLMDWCSSSSLFHVYAWLATPEWVVTLSGRDFMGLTVDNPEDCLSVERRVIIDDPYGDTRVPVTKTCMVIKDRVWKFGKRGSTIFLMEK